MVLLSLWLVEGMRTEARDGSVDASSLLRDVGYVESVAAARETRQQEEKCLSDKE